MHIELVRAWPHRHESRVVDLPSGSNVALALQVAGWSLDAEFTGVAVFGVVAGADTALHDGDRVELLRASWLSGWLVCCSGPIRGEFTLAIRVPAVACHALAVGSTRTRCKNGSAWVSFQPLDERIQPRFSCRIIAIVFGKAMLCGGG